MLEHFDPPAIAAALTHDRPARLRCEGARLVRPDGRDFLGRGVSFGSWAENLPGDAAECAGMGCNLIRDLLRWHGLYGHPDIDARDNDAIAFVRRENLQRLLMELLEITAADLWTCLAIDSNCMQSGTQTPEMRGYCDPKSLFGAAGRNACTDEPGLETFLIAWQSVARVARQLPRIAWLELLPEPLPGEQYDERWAPILADVYRKIIAGVRQVDPETPVLIGPRDAYNSDFLEEVYLPERTDVVYTFNILSGKLTNTKKRQRAIRDAMDFRERHAVPVWINQLGRKSAADPDLSFMRAALEECNEAGIGFAWWQNRQNTANPDEYALNYKTPDGRGWIQKVDEVALLSELLHEPARPKHERALAARVPAA
jgi:hypothetical protein